MSEANRERGGMMGGEELSNEREVAFADMQCVSVASLLPSFAPHPIFT